MRTNIISQQGMGKLLKKKSNGDSDPNYHANAQKFIKGAKAKGMSVKAEGGELIAYPKATAAFHKATQFGKHLEDKPKPRAKVIPKPKKVATRYSNGVGVGP